MNYTEFSDFNELINSYKELFSEVRISKNLVEGKKREVKNAKSLIDRKTGQANHLENRVDSIENSLNTTSSNFYNTFDNQKGQRIRDFFDLKRKREHLHWQRNKLNVQSQNDPTTITPVTEAQENRLNILILSINQSISQLESTIDTTFAGYEYDGVKDFNKPVLGEDSEQKIWEYYSYHIESLWIDHYFGLKYTIEDFMDIATTSHSEIEYKKNDLVTQMRLLENYRSNLSSALESNATESTIETIESQIETAKQSVRQAANDLAFIQAKIDALAVQTETTLRLWSGKADTYLYNAINYFNQNKKILVAGGVGNPEHEFQVRIVEMISPLVDVIKSSITSSINMPSASSFIYFIDQLFSKEETKNLNAKSHMRYMDQSSTKEFYLKNPDQLIQDVSFVENGNSRTKKVLKPEIPTGVIGDVISFYSTLSTNIQEVTDFKADVETRIMLFNEGWSNFATGNYMSEINSLKSQYDSLNFYRDFTQMEENRLNQGHYGITQEEKYSWQEAWVQKTMANSSIWLMQKEQSAAHRKRNRYESIFDEAFSQYYSLKSSKDNTQSAYEGTLAQYEFMNTEVSNAYYYLQTLTVGEADYVAALADYEAKVAAYDLAYADWVNKTDGPGGHEEAYAFLQTTLAGEAEYQAAYPFESYETNGSVSNSFAYGSGFDNYVTSTVTQTDGKILVVGAFENYNGTSANRIIRLNSDGSRDTSFVTGTGFDGTTVTIAIQSDGKILVGGQYTSYNGTSVLRIIRLNSDGSRDTSFVTGTGFDGIVEEITVQSDGKILVGGAFQGLIQGTSANRIIRLNWDGSVDTSFVTGTGFDGDVYKITVQSDGKIVVGGGFVNYNGTNAEKIIRLNSDGSRDTSFVIGTGFNGDILSVAIQTDGKILIGGGFTTYNGTGANYIIRLNSDGSIDTSFVYGSGMVGQVTSVAIQPNGKLLVGGQFDSYNGTSANKIIQLNSDGSVDTSFVSGTGFSGGKDVGGIIIQSNGSIIIIGSFTTYNGISANRIVMFSGSGSYPQTEIDRITALHYVYLGAQSDNDSKVAIKQAAWAVVENTEVLKNDAYTFLQDLTDEDAAYQGALIDWTNKDVAFSDYKNNVRTPAYDAWQAAEVLYNVFLGKEFRFYSATVTGSFIDQLIYDAEVLVPQQVSDAYTNANTKQQQFDELQSSLTWVVASENDKLNWLASERGQFSQYLQSVCNGINVEIDTLMAACGEPYLDGYVDYLKYEVGAVAGEWFTSNFESIMNDKMSVVEGFLNSINPLVDATITKGYNSQKYSRTLQSSSLWQDLGLWSIRNLIRASNSGEMRQQDLNGLGIELFDFLKNHLSGFNGIGTRPSIIAWLDNGGPITPGMI